MIRYAITDGARFGDNPLTRHEGLLADATRWAALGVDFVQLREKTLAAGELVRLAAAMMAVFHEHGGTTRLLVNGRADVAIAAGADGVHLTSAEEEVTPLQIRQLFAHAGRGEPLISASCHTVAEVERARDAQVNFALFGPIFEKSVAGALVQKGVGLDALRSACRVAEEVPVLALGGVDWENAAVCVEAGAAGVAGIRLFCE